MADPFESFRIDVVLGPERTLVEHHLGALIHHRPLVAAERSSSFVVFEEILAHLGSHLFEQEAQMGRDRIISQHRVARLDQVAGLDQGLFASSPGGIGGFVGVMLRAGALLLLGG